MSCSNGSLNHYVPGKIVRSQAAMETETDGATDPPGVLCEIIDPNDSLTTYTYGTDPDFLVRDSEGNYSCYVLADITGKWNYKWYAIDPDTPLKDRIAGVGEGAFLVDASPFSRGSSSSGGSGGGGLDGGSP